MISKELIDTKHVEVPQCFVGDTFEDLTITGRIYRCKYSGLFGLRKVKYKIRIMTPYIKDPFYDGEYNTNRRLQVAEDGLRSELEAIVERIKKEER